MIKKNYQPEEERASAEHVFVKKELEGEPVLKTKKKKPKAPLQETITAADEKKIDEEITKIYENEDGSLPDMTQFQKRHRRRFVTALATLFLACALFGGVAWAGFFVFQPAGTFSESDVVISISGDEEVVVGKEVRYRIRYRNAQSTSLANAVMQVRYPEGFVFTDSSVPPANEGKDEWRLGDLAKNDSGYIDIFGRMYGTVGEEQSFRLFFNYTPANFSSEFQKVASMTVKVASAPIVLTAAGPDEAPVGSSGVFTLALDPTNGMVLENVALEFESAVFAVSTSTPLPDQFTTNRWTAKRLDKPFAVSVRGTFSPSPGVAEGEAVIRVVGWKNAERQADPYVYAEKKVSVKFLQTHITANLVVNGASENLSVQPGEDLNMSIALKNAGDTPLENVVVRLLVDAPAVNRQSILSWTGLEDAADGTVKGEQLNAERRRGIVLWDRRQISGLRKIDPKKEVLIDVRLPLKDTETEDVSIYPHGPIEAVLDVEYTVNGEKNVFTTAPVVMTVNSDTAFEVRHTASEVNGRERHEVSWVLSNSYHELESIRTEMDVYGDVAFVKEMLKIPAGDAVYDEATKKLVWKIERMPTSLDVFALQFALDVKTKNVTQKNLTSKVRFEAIDTITRQTIRKAGDEILLSE